MSVFNLMNNNIKPREKLLKCGSEYLSDAELVAIILQVGSKNNSVMQVSQNMLEEAGGLENLFNFKYEQLRNFKAIGDVKAIKIIVISELIKRIEKEKSLKKIIAINSARDVHNLLKVRADEKQEYFYVLLLDTKNNLVAYKLIFIGTLNQITIHPREIFKYAVEKSADKIIIAHNHPSQSPLPSPQDVDITKKIYVLSQMMGIELVDHIIITENKWYSIFENHQIK